MRPTDGSSPYRGLPHHLETQVSYRLDVPLIYLRGELDHESSAKLRPVIEEELRAEPDVLLLDLSELFYMDSGGLGVMFDLVQRFRHPQWIGVVGPTPGIERLLQMTGLTDSDVVRMFPDIKSTSEALKKTA